MKDIFHDKRIMVTGACGTIGCELISQLLSDPIYSPSEVLGVDNNESALFFLDQHYIDDPRANFFVVDIRDCEEISHKMFGVDIVFHCAALKHVVLSEKSPEQVVKTNIIGTQNIITAAKANQVEKVIFTSSDKAVNPTNVMGTSKLMGERLITAANSNKRSNDGQIFTSTRFGNVLGSNGSVVPVFRNQIKKGEPITLTHRDMTRFIMSVRDSVKLVINSALYAQGGEVFITKMPVVRIVDLARAMIEELTPLYNIRKESVKIIEVGVKPGEKLYEELMSTEETRRAIELESYFSIMPAFRNLYHNVEYNYRSVGKKNVSGSYVSSNERPMSVLEIREFLVEKKIL